MKDEGADFGWQRNASLEGERGGATRIAGRGPAKKTMLSSGHASRGGGFHVFRSCKHGSGISRISSSSYKRDGLLSLDANLCHGGVFCASSPRGDILREKNAQRDREAGVVATALCRRVRLRSRAPARWDIFGGFAASTPRHSGAATSTSLLALPR